MPMHQVKSFDRISTVHVTMTHLRESSNFAEFSGTETYTISLHHNDTNIVKIDKQNTPPSDIITTNCTINNTESVKVLPDVTELITRSITT